MPKQDQTEAIEASAKEQRRTELLAESLRRKQDTNDPKVLEFLSLIDDGPELSDDSLDYLLSKTVSTANLSAEQVRGFEWRAELALLRRRQAHPPKHGLTGILRAVAFDDPKEAKEPLSAEEIIKHEGVGTLASLAATRSQDFEAVEKSTRHTSETFVNDGEEGLTGGALSRFR